MTNKVAVITGGASGIGLALAKVCLANNMQVALADNATSNLADAMESLHVFKHKLLSLRCDVTNLSDVNALVKETVKKFGRIDILFNNAGISGRLGSIWELSFEEIKKVIDINFYGIINCTKAFLPILFAQSFRSHIVNMASMYGLCSGSTMAPYAASKHAILAFSESLYFELQADQKPVDVSVVCPSFVNTSLIAHSFSDNPDSFNTMTASLMERSRPAEEVAEQIFKEVEHKTFYILPDKEVKNYCEQRVEAIINETSPYPHTLEKIIAALHKRASKNTK